MHKGKAQRVDGMGLWVTVYHVISLMHVLDFGKESINVFTHGSVLLADRDIFPLCPFSQA